MLTTTKKNPSLFSLVVAQLLPPPKLSEPPRPSEPPTVDHAQRLAELEALVCGSPRALNTSELAMAVGLGRTRTLACLNELIAQGRIRRQPQPGISCVYVKNEATE